MSEKNKYDNHNHNHNIQEAPKKRERNINAPESTQGVSGYYSQTWFIT